MIVIDYSDKRPIYEQIIERFRNLILSGVLEDNEKLPSVRALAIELSINPNTIQRAYSELEREGFICSVKGKGNFVNLNKSLMEVEQSRMLQELKTHLKKCKDFGIDVSQIEDCVKETFEEVTR